MEGHPSHRARARIAARERSLKATVAAFRGCLSDLPDRQRRLLELRTGLVSKPLGPGAVATRLHVRSDRFAELEVQAVRELRTASAFGCGVPSQIVAGVMSFISAGFGGGPGEARGGVKAASYSLNPKSLHAFKLLHGSRGGLLGAAIPSAAADVILVLLLLLACGIVVSIVAADAAGKGPRHRNWRRRVGMHVPWLRRPEGEQPPPGRR